MLEHIHSEPNDDTLDAAMRLRPRPLSDHQILKFEKYIEEIFGAVGMDLDTPATRETPRRFMRALLDMTESYEGDPKCSRYLRLSAAVSPTAILPK